VRWGTSGRVPADDLAVSTVNTVGAGRPAQPALGQLGQLAAVARPRSTAWAASDDSVTRVAHVSAHQARSSGVAKHHTDAPGLDSAKPARRVTPAGGAGVRLAAVLPGELPVERQPAVEGGLGGAHVMAA